MIVTGLMMLFIAGTAGAQDVISAADAAKIMKDDNVVVVSTRKSTDYAKVHVPGAVHLDHKALYGDLSMLKSPNEIAGILGSKGISNTNKILLYDDGSGKYSGRMYWILKYIGAQDVKIIDGGMKGWRIARKPVTKNPTQAKSATFSAKLNSALIADMNRVKSATSNPNILVVDARSPEEFKGTASTKLRPGHIPSAINFEYKKVLNDNGTLKSKEELKKVFASAGITPDKEVIVYCESSVRAGIVFMALKSMLNYPKVRIYDGAYLQWQSSTQNKVTL